jgi:hypothetical protein
MMSIPTETLNGARYLVEMMTNVTQHAADELYGMEASLNADEWIDTIPLDDTDYIMERLTRLTNVLAELSNETEAALEEIKAATTRVQNEITNARNKSM